ncbi:MAG TPA: tetratricopeptide repeat protein [Gemmataceae bacterium]|nr:tetratricopeptide repeat protein [Gemmataceae bacterium]
MRRIVLSAAILMGILAQAGSLQAGVYNLDAPRKYPRDYAQVNALDPIWRVLVHLGELRAVHDAAKAPYKADSLRAAYEKQLADLETRQRDGLLTPTDRVNMGACLIRMGRFPKARELLEESLRVVPPDDSVYFLLLLNLASAYQEDDALLQRAIDLQTQGLRNWPAMFPGWNRWESSWYRHAEQYALTLMRLRQREQIRNGGRSVNELPPLDDLFGNVRFVGSSGNYEAGGIAFEQWNKLPVDAERIVLQLLLWRPLDPRLNWLYGELLNARGQVDWAFSVLDFCKQLASNRELRQHHVVLRESVNAYKVLFADSSGPGDNLRKQLLWSLSPRGALLAPAIGVAANEIGGVAASANPAISTEALAPAERSTTQGTPAPRLGTALPDWRQLAVSFITGMVVAVLGILQWQQWRRHRRDETATSVRTESVSEKSR